MKKLFYVVNGKRTVFVFKKGKYLRNFAEFAGIRLVRNLYKQRAFVKNNRGRIFIRKSYKLKSRNRGKFALFGSYFEVVNTILTTNEDDFDKVNDGSEEIYIKDMSYEYGGSEHYRIDLTDATEPYCDINMHSSEYAEGYGEIYSYTINATLTMCNLNNTVVEFDIDKVDVKDTDDFDWDFFAELYGYNAEEGGN